MLVSALHLRDWAGRDNLGVEALGQFGKTLHDALDVNHDGFESAGDHGHFLLQVIAGNGDTVTHQDLI